MGNTLSRGTLDVIYILFPFVLSAGLIIMIVVCWWKCKIFIDKRRPAGKTPRFRNHDQPDFGHLINIQEYAENQIGTTIVYADSTGSSCPHPYVYFSDGRITRIVPLTPTPTYSSQQQHQDHSSCPSVLLCNNLPHTRNNNMNVEYSCHHNNYNNLHPYSQDKRKSISEEKVVEVPSTSTSCASASEVKTETETIEIITSTIINNCEIKTETQSGNLESKKRPLSQ